MKVIIDIDAARPSCDGPVILVKKKFEQKVGSSMCHLAENIIAQYFYDYVTKEADRLIAEQWGDEEDQLLKVSTEKQDGEQNSDKPGGIP